MTWQAISARPWLAAARAAATAAHKTLHRERAAATEAAAEAGDVAAQLSASTAARVAAEVAAAATEFETERAAQEYEYDVALAEEKEYVAELQGDIADLQARLTEAKVGRCRLSVSKPVVQARLVLALETKM
jgi:hypothetical protein